MRHKIIFADETTRIQVGNTIATIHTGESQAARNRIAALSVQSPREAARFNALLEAVAIRCSEGGEFEPNVPQLEAAGNGLWLMFGLVVTGRGRWLITAAFYFVMVTENEIDYFAAHLFKAEKVLGKEQR